MKKKLLSLVLAGAMVASTSVSAFAAGTNNVIKDSDTSAPTTNVEITGEVLGNSGQRPEGKFNVTVPTTAMFTVTQEGNLQGTTIKVINNGTQSIDVYADKFLDTQVGTGIKVVSEDNLVGADRTNVSLKLKGNVNTLFLKSESESQRSDNHTGLYKTANLEDNNKATADTDLKIANIKSNDQYDLTLSGSAGKSNPEQVNAVSNSFTLTLKIKKSNSN